MAEYVVDLTDKQVTDLRYMRRERITRCRDCMHMRHVGGAGHVCERLPFRFRTGPNMFCSWGERRTG